jgi:hypothetical protein
MKACFNELYTHLLSPKEGLQVTTSHQVRMTYSCSISGLSVRTASHRSAFFRIL